MLKPLTSEQKSWVNDTLNKMSLAECAGQLLCAFNPSGNTDDWLELLKKVPIGALTIQRASTPDLRAQIQILQNASDIPLLVTADLEHGASSLTDGTEFPWMMAAGAANDAELMRVMGEATAAEARYAGMHWTFSPVVDLNYNFNNPITNIRSLGDKPQRVKGLAKAIIEGMQSAGQLAATAKHFPGDGMDDRDQHISTTVNTLPFTQWQETYGQVWREVINAGVMCIMPGHISLPDYQGFQDNPEDAPPATLSSKLLIDLLRKELGFDGLLISDASGMIGVASRLPSNKRIVESIKAGLDMYLFPDTLADYERLIQAVKDGDLAEERVRDAARRILEMKARLNLHKDTFGPKPTDAKKQSYQAAAQSMADKSISMARTSKQLTLKLESAAKVLTVTVGQVSSYSKFMPQPELPVFDDELRQRGFEVEHLLNPADDLLLAKAAESAVVFVNLLVIPYMELGSIRNLVGHLGHWQWRSFFVDHPQVCFTSFGNPYVLHEMPHLPNLMLTYGNSAVSQKAAVKVWLGELEAQGDCPVKLPKLRIKALAED